MLVRWNRKLSRRGYRTANKQMNSLKLVLRISCLIGVMWLILQLGPGLASSCAAHGNQLSNCCRLMPSFLIRKRVVEGFRLSSRAAPAGPSMTPWVFFRIARIC